jgi:hypothetical protein
MTVKQCVTEWHWTGKGSNGEPFAMRGDHSS